MMFVIKEFGKMKAKTRRQRIFERYFFFKLCFARAHGYFQMPASVGQTLIIITLWLKLYLGFTDGWKIVIWSIIGFILFMLIGYIDIKKRIVNEETAFGNRYNPDIMEIKRNVKR